MGILRVPGSSSLAILFPLIAAVNESHDQCEHNEAVESAFELPFVLVPRPVTLIVLLVLVLSNARCLATLLPV